MNIKVFPSEIKGSVIAPASKSSMQRACAAALLKQGVTVLKNPGHSNDDKAALGIIRNLGADVTVSQNEVVIKSKGVHPVSEAINCGESGLSIRMFTPLAALSNRQITINGSGSLLNRPMDFFDQILPQLGVSIKSNAGKLPLVVKGPLQPKNIEVDGSLSSQFLTGLLMAYGAAATPSSQTGHAAIIKVSNLKSKPYIDLTLDVMKQFGFLIPENNNYREFIFRYDDEKQNSDRQQTEYTVEGDWSGGAFLLVTGAIAGAITVRGLDLTSTQADKTIVDALMAANAGIAMEAKGIKIGPTKMKGFEFDATDCPDLFPPLVALASCCKGDTQLKGVSRLTHKESNRAETLKEEFSKMGVQIDWEDDVMLVKGGAELKGAIVHSHHDHRIAMACAVAALKAKGATEIQEARAVNKSYPGFWNDLQRLGARIEVPGFIL